MCVIEKVLILKINCLWLCQVGSRDITFQTKRISISKSFTKAFPLSKPTYETDSPAINKDTRTTTLKTYKMLN